MLQGVGFTEWRLPPANVLLASGEVHVWQVNVDAVAQYRLSYERVLSPDEQRRSALYRFDKDRVRFTTGRAALRFILGRYTSESPAELRFSKGPYGKLALISDSEEAVPNFSVTHSNALILIALARTHLVGVDVEKYDAAFPVDAISTRFLHLGEQSALRSLPKDKRACGFLVCWTRKEAYLKAIGCGLCVGLDQFEVSTDLAEASLRRVSWDPDDAERWSLQSLAAHPEYIAALAVKGKDFDMKFWDGNSLLA